MTRDDVVNEARSWLGVPYRDQGRSRTGLDCLGLLIMLGRRFEIPHRDELAYSNWPDKDHTILRRLGESLLRLSPGVAKPGTIGVFAEKRLPGHVGVFSSKHGVDHLIHASIRNKQVIEAAWEATPRTELRLVAQFGLPGMDL